MKLGLGGIPPVIPVPVEPANVANGDSFAALLAAATEATTGDKGRPQATSLIEATTGDDQRQVATEATDVLVESDEIGDVEDSRREENGDVLIAPPQPLTLPVSPLLHPTISSTSPVMRQAIPDSEASGGAATVERAGVPVAVSAVDAPDTEQPQAAGAALVSASHEPNEPVAPPNEIEMAPTPPVAAAEPQPGHVSDVRLAAAVAVLREVLGQVASDDSPATSQQAVPAVERKPAAATASADSGTTDGESTDADGEGQPPRQAGIESRPPSEPSREPVPMSGPTPVGLAATRPSSPVVAPVAPVAMQQLPAESTAGPTRMVTIQVNAADGSVARVRVALVGDVVRATIIAEPGAAAALETALPELHRALGDRGFSESQVTVRSVAADAALAAPARHGSAADGRSTEQQQQREPGEQPRWHAGRDDRSRQERRNSQDRGNQ